MTKYKRFIFRLFLSNIQLYMRVTAAKTKNDGSERQRNFSRRQSAGSSSIATKAFSQCRSVRTDKTVLTFTAAFATPDGRHQLRLIDIHIDKGRIDGRPMILSSRERRSCLRV